MAFNVNTGKVEGKAYRIFMLWFLVIFATLFSGIFFGMAIRYTEIINESIIARGRSLFQQIVLTRSWAASYGGVYVKKGPGVESNPYLIHPDLEAEGGLTLTLRNPALITREISKLTSKESDYRFSITSLNPLNPNNTPDTFETTALKSFESGEAEFWTTVTDDNIQEFRYMGALTTENSCLACHAAQGYKEGDVRGGISVSFSIQPLKKKLNQDIFIIVAIGIILLITSLILVYKLVYNLRHKLELTRKALADAAITDELTALYNRRYAMLRLHEEIEKAIRTNTEVTCVIFDADFFKSVNDEEGHLVGDLVLQTIAKAFKSECRSYDILSRYGGEEFLLIFLGITTDEALSTCERIRKVIPEMTEKALVSQRRVSMSAGLASLSFVKETPEDIKIDAAILAHNLLLLADEALYSAKKTGRNKCVVYAKEE